MININSNNSSCEDTVNLLNVKGSIDKINIESSFSDALDVDFSDIEINSIIFSFHLGGNESICRTRERESVDASPCHPEA